MDKYLNLNNIFELTLEIKDNIILIKDQDYNSNILLRYNPASSNVENMFEFGIVKEIYELYNDHFNYLSNNDVFYFNQETDYAGGFSAFNNTKGDHGYIYNFTFEDLLQKLEN